MRADDNVARTPDRDVIDAAPEQPPPEDNPISLTLWPFWAIPADANGFGSPEPLGDVRVCVARKRRYEDPWEAFVETNEPCIESTAPNEKVVLTRVPAMSELILTAEKEGFAPRAFAVVTGQSDQDATLLQDVKQMHLFPLDAVPHVFPGADLRRGQLILFAFSGSFDDAGDWVLSWLGGVRASLEPASGDGPFYGHAGVVAKGATETAPGGSIVSLDDSTYAGFTNLLEGEYFVHADHPDRVCYPYLGGGDSLWGYPDTRPGVIRAPVLPGYFTEVGAQC